MNSHRESSGRPPCAEEALAAIYKDAEYDRLSEKTYRGDPPQYPSQEIQVHLSSAQRKAKNAGPNDCSSCLVGAFGRCPLKEGSPPQGVEVFLSLGSTSLAVTSALKGRGSFPHKKDIRRLNPSISPDYLMGATVQTLAEIDHIGDPKVAEDIGYRIPT
jgi:hypothetical protein